ncbi:MAG: hypothetical protein IJI54_11930 [Kiritimatiellae bacterium]|nr:hypothetical protein [Kiritimatiellia bacterium]
MKTKMRHKIERIPLLALFLSAATSVVAGEVVSVSLPDPMFNNCESTAKAMLPILEAGTSERLVVSINCPNTITNEFEVWFCTDEDASREFRDLAISLDDGYLFVSGRDDENLLQDWTSMPWGQCHLGIELRNRLYSHYHDIPVITTFSICGVIVEMKPQKTRDNSQHIRMKSLSRNPIRCP